MTVRCTRGLMTSRLLVAAIGAAAALAACTGCEDKKPAAKKPKVQQASPDWNSQWGDIRTLGMEGKHWCLQGLKKCQEAGAQEDRTESYELMVKGYKLVQQAADKADALLAAAQKQSPGNDFTGWEDEVAGWQEPLKPVKAMLPNEYLDKLHQ